MCEYCEGCKFIQHSLADGMVSVRLEIDDNPRISCLLDVEEVSNFYFQFEDDFEINYCPMCGRKLR